MHGPALDTLLIMIYVLLRCMSDHSCWTIIFILLELFLRYLIHYQGRRDDFVLKNTYSSCRGPRFSLQYPYGGSKPPTAPVPGDPAPSFSLCGSQAQVCMDIHAGKKKTHTHKNMILLSTFIERSTLNSNCNGLVTSQRQDAPKEIHCSSKFEFVWRCAACSSPSWILLTPVPSWPCAR